MRPQQTPLGVRFIGGVLKQKTPRRRPTDCGARSPRYRVLLVFGNFGTWVVRDIGVTWGLCKERPGDWNVSFWRNTHCLIFELQVKVDWGDIRDMKVG